MDLFELLMKAEDVSWCCSLGAPGQVAQDAAMSLPLAWGILVFLQPHLTASCCTKWSQPQGAPRDLRVSLPFHLLPPADGSALLCSS